MGCSFSNTERHSGYIYLRPTTRTPIKNAYAYINIYINTELLDGNKGHQKERHRPTHRFRSLFLDLLQMRWRGCASAMGVIKLTSSVMHHATQLYFVKRLTVNINGCVWWQFLVCSILFHHCLALPCVSRCAYQSTLLNLTTVMWIIDHSRHELECFSVCLFAFFFAFF